MADFESKPVPTPMLDGETKAQLNTVPAPAVPPTAGEASALGTGTPGSGGFFGKNKWYITAGVLALAVIGLLMFFALAEEPAPTEANIFLAIDAPEYFPSSGEVVVKVAIENKDAQTLVGMELEMVYPEGISYVFATPKSNNLSGTLFSVPDLQSGQNTVLVLKLRSQGSVGESKNLTARLRYKYNNITSSFLKESHAPYTITSSKLAIDIQGPNTTNNTQLVTYIVKYVNNDDKPLANGRLELSYPKGFAFAVANPSPSIGKNIWNIGTLGANRSGEITITGTFKHATPGETQSFTAEYAVLDASGSYHVQATNSFDTSISSVPLLVSQELENSNGVLVANPGETLTYTIRYQNNETFAAKSVNIVWTFDSKAVDTNSIQAEGAQVSSNTVTWNASSVSNLDVINPNEGGILRLSFKVKNPPVKDSSKNVDVKSAVKIKSSEYETFFPGNDLQVKISSIASLATSLKFESGQLPPRVGQTTEYTITLSLKNLTNDIKDGVLTAFLALDPTSFETQSVLPTGEASKAQFDPSSGRFTWNVGQLRAHTGDFSEPRSVSFTVKLNPSVAQVGEAPVLLRNIRFVGTDTFTEQPVELTVEDITTDQLSGQDGYNKGRVVE